ncbi:MAG: L-threonylcarbamoyladenylate synthase [Acidobacteriota bacterium]
METLLTESAETAAAVIRNGGVVAFPTETVYGLGANVFDSDAVCRIFAAKMRPADNPLIAHISERGQIESLSRELTPSAERFIEAFFPGPLTIVVRRSDRVSDVATAGLDTIGIRMPRFEIAHRFITACGVPVVAPSANLSGRPSPTTWEAVFEDLNGRIDCILQGDATEIGLESTVVDCTTDAPKLLRLGSVTLEQLQEVVPATIAAAIGDMDALRSPGLRHKHYSPRAEVALVSGPSDISLTADSQTAFIGISPSGREFGLERICASVDEYAHIVFEFFRECDRQGITAIYCQSVPDTGLGAALMDRLRRAAEG